LFRCEILHASEQRVDLPVVGDVVAEVRHRRLEERRDPDCVDTEAGDVVEAFDDAGETADAVAVGVEKTARMDR